MSRLDFCSGGRTLDICLHKRWIALRVVGKTFSEFVLWVYKAAGSELVPADKKLFSSDE